MAYEQGGGHVYALRFFVCLLWIHVPLIAGIAAWGGAPLWPLALAMTGAALAATIAARAGRGGFVSRSTIACALLVAPALLSCAAEGAWRAVAALTDLVIVLGFAWRMREHLCGAAAGPAQLDDAFFNVKLLKSVVARDAMVATEVPLAVDGSLDVARRRILHVNETFTTLTGIAGSDAVGKTFNSLVDIETDISAITAAYQTASRDEISYLDLLWRLPSGDEISLESTIVRIESNDERAMRFVQLLRDVTARRNAGNALLRARLAEENNAALQQEIADRVRAEELLAHAAYHDELTGFPNRTLFREHLTRALAQDGLKVKPSVLLCDFDRFRNVNDGLGHAIGDKLLTTIALRLKGALRDQDMLARFGGDEFAILIEDAENIEAATKVAERILNVLTTPYRIEGHDIFITASIGVAAGETVNDTPDHILRKADLAMYRAKALGKARYEVFTPDLLKRSERLLELETTLRAALERSELHPHYQPIIDFVTGRPCGFEALARWTRPEVGAVPPNEFIPLAEDTGLIVTLGQQMLNEACGQLSRWIKVLPHSGDIWVSVNVSPLQLREPNYLSTVTQALARHRLAGRHLHLEVTETTIAGDLQVIGPILAGLRDLGVHISIDDFGTGYSSLRYLDQLPIDSLKIDRSFISGRGEHIANLKITQSVVSLAVGLGLEVVAEGVETESQNATLRSLTRYGQGYLFGRPMSAEAASAYLKEALEIRIDFSKTA